MFIAQFTNLISSLAGRFNFLSRRINARWFFCQSQSRRILILHGETLYRTYLNTQITGAAFEAIDLPFFAIFGDLDGVGRAAPAAHPAENALIDIHFNSAPGNRGKSPLLFRVHQRCGSAEQVLGYGFGHCKQSHFLDLLPFCATDAGVEGEDDIRDIGDLRSLQDFDHCRDIAESGYSHPKPLKNSTFIRSPRSRTRN